MLVVIGILGAILLISFVLIAAIEFWIGYSLTIEQPSLSDRFHEYFERKGREYARKKNYTRQEREKDTNRATNYRDIR